MGEHRNGGSPPDDGGEHYARDLPELPPEWGEVVVPDDLSELDAEVRAVRRELARRGLGTGAREPVALRVPIAIMVIAVLMALVSLIVMTWGRPPVGSLPSVSLSASASGADLSGVALLDASGGQVALPSLLPAVVMLVDRCACPDLVRDVAEVTPGPMTVVAVGLASLDPAGFGGNVRLLADPAGRLASLVPPGPGAGATVFVVDMTGRVVAVARGVRRLADLEPIMSRW